MKRDIVKMGRNASPFVYICRVSPLCGFMKWRVLVQVNYIGVCACVGSIDGSARTINISIEFIIIVALKRNFVVVNSFTFHAYIDCITGLLMQ